MCNKTSLTPNIDCKVESITLVQPDSFYHINFTQPLYTDFNGALRFVYYLALGEFEYREDFDMY